MLHIDKCLKVYNEVKKRAFFFELLEVVIIQYPQGVIYFILVKKIPDVLVLILDGLLVFSEVQIEDVFGCVLVKVVLAVGPLDYDCCLSQLHVFVAVQPGLYLRLREDHLTQEGCCFGCFGEALEVLLDLPEVLLAKLAFGVEVGSHNERFAAYLRQKRK